MDKSLTELTYREIKKYGVFSKLLILVTSWDIRNVKPLRPYIDTLILYAFGMRRIFQKAIRLMFAHILTFYRDFLL